MEELVCLGCDWIAFTFALPRCDSISDSIANSFGYRDIPPSI